jgi:hypothetical protein
MDRSFFAPEQECAPGEDQGSGDGPRKTGRSLALGGVMLAAALLAGCVDSYVGAERPQAPPPEVSNMARRPGVNPGGATVAVASFAGGSDAIRDRFSQAFNQAASTQQIVMSTPGAAGYLVRGYLNAVPEGEGTAVSYVLDIFDAKKHRTQRVEDQILIPAHAADPWSVVDDSALTALASKSASELAAVLTNTPQAILAAAKTQTDPQAGPAETTSATAQVEDGKTVVAATPAVGPPGDGKLGNLALHSQ